MHFIFKQISKCYMIVLKIIKTHGEHEKKRK